MLRIKKDVEYTTLKKWFIRKTTFGATYYEPRNNKIKLLINTYRILCLTPQAAIGIFNNETLDTIYDLIQSGLIEKVSEGDNE